MANVSGLGYFLLLLGVLVAVHEFGHFIVAKMCGVKVLKFSIGFGPRLIGFTRGETEYRISLLPLGGYVKMAGEQPYEELTPEEARRGFLAQPPWKRILIVAAGPAFNLLFPILIFFFVYLGQHQDLAAYVGTVEQGMPAAAAGIKPGDFITEIDGEKVTTFDDMKELLKDRADQEVPITVKRGDQLLSLKVKPMSGLENNRIETVKRGFVGILPFPRAPYIGVAKDSVADKAGLKTFDRVLSVNGTNVATMEQFEAALAKAGGEVDLKVVRSEPVKVPGVNAALPKIVDVKVPKQEGAQLAAIGAESPDLYVNYVHPNSPEANAGLAAGDRIVAADGLVLPSAQILMLKWEELGQKPYQLEWIHAGEKKSATVSRQKKEIKDELGNKLPTTAAGFGIGPGPIQAVENLKPELVTFRMGPVQALQASMNQVPEMIRQTVVVLRGLFTREVPVESVGGPIMMYQLAARASEQGTEYFLRLLAIISVNLGIMNLLPIPVLDGFGLLSAAWEGIRRRPIPMRAREVANLIGLAMLVILMVMVFVNDTKKALNKDEATTEQTQ